MEAPDETSRKDRLADHARQVRQHIENLGSKSYWNQFEPTPEFVVLFLPGEVFFRAAMDADPELIEYGVSRKVIVASPTTLIALLRAVAYGWNQKNLADSAREISAAGKTLYQRLSAMAGHFEDIGKRLGGAVESYNKAVGSMERSVFPIARKLPELDRSLSADDLAGLASGGEDAAAIGVARLATASRSGAVVSGWKSRRSRKKSTWIAPSRGIGALTRDFERLIS